MKLKFLALLATVVFAFGCKKYDIHPPLLTEININGNTENVVLQAGINYSLFYRVEDNKGIDHIRITTLKGFKLEKDPHTTATDWAFIYDIDYDQTSKSEPRPFNVPANVAPGTYRVKVEISDLNNNVVTEKSMNFTVVAGDNSQPAVSTVTLGSTTTPNTNGVVYAKRGDRLRFYGNVSTASNLTELKVEMWSATENIWSKKIALTGTSNTSVDLLQMDSTINLVVNPNLTKGDYKVAIYAKDGSNKVGAKVFNVGVLY